MAWQVDPANYGAHTVINFSQGMHATKPAVQQFPWMSMRFPSSGTGPNVAPMTSGGCCMALTVHFFEWYRAGRNMAAYFTWLQKPSGISSVMNMQMKYLGWMTSFGQAPVQSVNSMMQVLNALRRKVEDEIYGAKNFQSVGSPWLPSLTSSLPEKVMEDFSGYGRVFKPIYLASLTGGAHAIGAILDYNNNAFIFFDPNEGMAEFANSQHMLTWLQQVEPDYSDDFTAFFADTKT